MDKLTRGSLKAWMPYLALLALVGCLENKFAPPAGTNPVTVVVPKPSIALSQDAGTQAKTLATPHFDITLAGGIDFRTGDRLLLFPNGTCAGTSPTAVGAAVGSTTTTLIYGTAMTDSEMLSFSAQMLDADNNLSDCSSSVSYRYSHTVVVGGPGVPVLVQALPSVPLFNDPNPSFNITLDDGSGDFSGISKIDLVTGSCNGTPVKTITDFTKTATTQTIVAPTMTDSATGTNFYAVVYDSGTPALSNCSDPVSYQYVDYDFNQSVVTVSAPTVVLSSNQTIAVSISLMKKLSTPQSPQPSTNASGFQNQIAGLDIMKIAFSNSGLSNSGGTFSPLLNPSSDGVYTSTFTPTQVGAPNTVNVTIMGVPIANLPQIEVQTTAAPGEPTRLVLSQPTPAPNGITVGNNAKPTITVTGGSQAANGTNTAELFVANGSVKCGTSVGTGLIVGSGSTLHADITLTSALPEGTTTFYAKNKIAGVYSACSNSTSTGSVAYRYLDFDLNNSVVTLAGGASTMTEAGTLVATLTIKHSTANGGGTNTAATGLIVQFILGGSGTSAPTFASVTDANNGTYTSVISGGAGTAGTARTIGASINQQVILSTAPSLTITPSSNPVAITFDASQSTTTDPVINFVVTFGFAPDTTAGAGIKVFDATSVTAVPGVTFAVTAGADSKTFNLQATATNAITLTPEIAAGAVTANGGTLPNADSSLSPSGGVTYTPPAKVGFLKVVSGENHACGLTVGGAAFCWGDETYGQLGNGVVAHQVQISTPVAVSMSAISPVTFTDIAVGTNHTCALGSNGVVYCWGDDTNGEQGNGATAGTQSVPTPVSPLTNVVYTQISAKQFTTCALGANGKVYCWGSNANDQITTGGATTKPTVLVPTATVGTVAARKVSVGSTNACMLDEDGLILCWGKANTLGRFNGTADTDTPTSILTTTGETFMDVAAGGNGGCAITSGTNQSTTKINGGVLYCWGSNATGQVGDGTAAAKATPVLVALQTGISFKKVTQGPNHTCALSTKGVPYCWGSNNNGQIGNASTATTPVLSPAPVNLSNLPAGATFLDIDANAAETCGIATDGKAYCWGDDGFAQLGDVANGDQTKPVAVDTGNIPAGNAFRSLYTGQDFSCAISADFTTSCWGLNTNGQLGIGNTTNQISPVTLTNPTGAVFTKLSLGVTHACGLASDGNIYCWGKGAQGQLGNAAQAEMHTPVVVATSGMTGDTAFTDVTVGALHSCGVTGAGAYCWGAGSSGRLGDGLSTDSDVPSKVSTVTGFIDIAAGASHTCGVVGTGDVYCWGLASSGQLGNSTTTTAATPVKASGTLSYKHIVSGDNHVCALTSYGAIECWGSGSSSQNGVAGAVNKTAPTAIVLPVHTGTTHFSAGVFAPVSTSTYLFFTALDAIGINSCALGTIPGGTAGRDYCWGDNTYNQLGVTGDGETGRGSLLAIADYPTTALKDPNLTGNVVGSQLISIGAGGSFSCAMSNRNEIYCWGSNSDGQLGDKGQPNTKITDPAVVVSDPQ